MTGQHDCRGHVIIELNKQRAARLTRAQARAAHPSHWHIEPAGVPFTIGFVHSVPAGMDTSAIEAAGPWYKTELNQVVRQHHSSTGKLALEMLVQVRWQFNAGHQFITNAHVDTVGIRCQDDVTFTVTPKFLPPCSHDAIGLDRRGGSRISLTVDVDIWFAAGPAVNAAADEAVATAHTRLEGEIRSDGIGRIRAAM